jgi:hypothetical protein
VAGPVTNAALDDLNQLGPTLSHPGVRRLATADRQGTKDNRGDL